MLREKELYTKLSDIEQKVTWLTEEFETVGKENE